MNAPWWTLLCFRGTKTNSVAYLDLMKKMANRCFKKREACVQVWEKLTSHVALVSALRQYCSVATTARLPWKWAFSNKTFVSSSACTLTVHYFRLMLYAINTESSKLWKKSAHYVAPYCQRFMSWTADVRRQKYSSVDKVITLSTNGRRAASVGMVNCSCQECKRNLETRSLTANVTLPI